MELQTTKDRCKKARYRNQVTRREKVATANVRAPTDTQPFIAYYDVTIDRGWCAARTCDRDGMEERSTAERRPAAVAATKVDQLNDGRSLAVGR